MVAVACLRGGGEFGSAWHDDGRLANKQHVFDDAIAAAEHLIASGWTTADRLALTGGSNGGLLAGAVLTQRPDLFAAVVPEVGVLDMLRFPLWTIGWAWISDYGDPRADAAQFRTLLRVLAAAQPARGRGLPAGARHDQRPRRPRRPGAQHEVRGAAAGGRRRPTRSRCCGSEPAGGHKEPDARTTR